MACQVNECEQAEQRGIVPNIGPCHPINLCNQHAYALFRNRLTLDSGIIIEGVQFFGDSATLRR